VDRFNIILYIPTQYIIILHETKTEKIQTSLVMGLWKHIFINKVSLIKYIINIYKREGGMEQPE
jgi:hypothetical protein